ncbi:hypothetical protein KSC_107720 [Ktedonobacter sp. SOSP1-52]|nr:hypothetical protein KSC_107720 [Ktedonobacter sp. SOSP1-52]
MYVDNTRGCRLGRMTQEEVLSQEALRHPISSYFLSTEKGDTIMPTELSFTMCFLGEAVFRCT